MADVLVLKLTDRLLSERGLTVADMSPIMLQKRASGAWKIGPKRLDKVEMVLVLYKETVIAQFTLGKLITYNRETHRSSLEFNDYEGNNHLVGSKLNYKTNNPATIKTTEQLKNLIVEIRRGSNRPGDVNWQSVLFDFQRRLSQLVVGRGNGKSYLLDFTAPFTFGHGNELEITFNPYFHYYGVNEDKAIRDYVVNHYQEISTANRKTLYLGYDLDKQQYYLSDFSIDDAKHADKAQYYQTGNEVFEALMAKIKVASDKLRSFVEEKAHSEDQEERRLMSDQFHQLVETVEKASVSDDWQGAKSEWDVVDISEDDSLSENCICGQERLKYLYTIENRFNHNVLFPIGSHCINQFNQTAMTTSATVYQKLLALVNAVKDNKFIELNATFFSRGMLKYLYDDGVFKASIYNKNDPYNDYKFLLDMFNKRSDPTSKQQAKINALIMNAIIPYAEQRIKKGQLNQPLVTVIKQ